MVTLLAGALKQNPRSKETIRKLKAEVFRYDQLYEPAGNVFVTVGIMATFLGLAVGLVTVDLSSMTEGTPEAMVLTLKSLITCMGLGLGVSLLGVILALLSQGLRGHGPRQTTEAILEMAVSILEAAVKRPRKATTLDTPAAG